MAPYFVANSGRKIGFAVCIFLNGRETLKQTKEL